MESLFIHLFNMSLSASWVVIAVILLRLVFAKAPKYIRCIMWSFVGLRLIFPFSFKSILSLIPSTNTVTNEILYSPAPTVNTGVDIFDRNVNPIISSSLAPNVGDSVNPMQVIAFIASIIWIAGIICMIIYSAISYFTVKYKVRGSIEQSKGIMLCDNIPSPFILGIIKPVIYIPTGLCDEDLSYVISHEKAHIKRLDYIWKPIGFLLLTIYWFNPLMWVSYIFLCRDIELACDEKVIKELGADIKKNYSQALINLSISKKFISACPLAFGEGSVNKRIKSILSYKKPTLWILIIAIISCIILGVCFLTDPIDKNSDSYGISTIEKSCNYEGVSMIIENASLSEDMPYIELNIYNQTEQKISFGENFKLYKDGQDLTKDYVSHLILHSISPSNKDRLKLYLTGIELSDGVYRLEKPFTVGDSEKIYTALIEFQIKRAFFTGKTYYAQEIVYDNGSFSYNLSEDDILKKFSIDDKNGLWRGHSMFKQITLTKINFDNLTTTKTWKEGFSAKTLRKQNKQAFKVETSSGNLYYVLEQQNGEVYLANGYTTPNIIRYILKVSENEVINTSGISQTYYFNGSPDTIKPNLLIDYVSNTFIFNFSGFSSYVPMGNVYETNTGYRLDTQDGQNSYFFNFKGENLVFDAKHSSALPKYKYSADSEAVSPVPDGAVFEKENSENVKHLWYDTTEFDIDGDKLLEQFSVGPGFTSGLFTINIRVTNGEFIYSEQFQCEPMANIHFKVSENNELVVVGTGYKNKEVSYIVEFEDGRIYLK